MNWTRGSSDNNSKPLRRCFALLLMLLAPPYAWADATLDIVEKMSFGVFALRSNSAPSTLRLSAAGRVTASGDIIPVGTALAGNYRLSGFPPSTILTFELDNAQLTEGGFGLPEPFQVTNFEFPVSLLTNAAGEADLSLGGRLQSSGSGTLYSDGPYEGSTQLRIRYWSAGVNEYLTYIDQIDIVARAQSTLTVLENQPLSFGTVAAFPHVSNVAQLRLSPKGVMSTTSTGPGARLIALGGAQPGKFQVTGAAANQTINITPQSGSIFLTHTALGSNTPRFVAKDFTTLPSGTGKTNASGELSVALGASLETEPSTQGYADGEYRGTYTLEVSY